MAAAEKQVGTRQPDVEKARDPKGTFVLDPNRDNSNFIKSAIFPKIGVTNGVFHSRIFTGQGLSGISNSTKAENLTSFRQRSSETEPFFAFIQEGTSILVLVSVHADGTIDKNSSVAVVSGKKDELADLDAGIFEYVINFAQKRLAISPNAMDRVNRYFGSETIEKKITPISVPEKKPERNSESIKSWIIEPNTIDRRILDELNISYIDTLFSHSLNHRRKDGNPKGGTISDLLTENNNNNNFPSETAYIAVANNDKNYGFFMALTPDRSQTIANSVILVSANKDNIRYLESEDIKRLKEIADQALSQDIIGHVISQGSVPTPDDTLIQQYEKFLEGSDFATPPAPIETDKTAEEQEAAAEIEVLRPAENEYILRRLITSGMWENGQVIKQPEIDEVQFQQLVSVLAESAAAQHYHSDYLDVISVVNGNLTPPIELYLTETGETQVEEIEEELEAAKERLPKQNKFLLETTLREWLNSVIKSYANIASNEGTTFSPSIDLTIKLHLFSEDPTSEALSLQLFALGGNGPEKINDVVVWFSGHGGSLEYAVRSLNHNLDINTLKYFYPELINQEIATRQLEESQKPIFEKEDLSLIEQNLKERIEAAYKLVIGGEKTKPKQMHQLLSPKVLTSIFSGNDDSDRMLMAAFAFPERGKLLNIGTNARRDLGQSVLSMAERIFDERSGKNKVTCKLVTSSLGTELALEAAHTNPKLTMPGKDPNVFSIPRGETNHDDFSKWITFVMLNHFWQEMNDISKTQQLNFDDGRISMYAKEEIADGKIRRQIIINLRDSNNAIVGTPFVIEFDSVPTDIDTPGIRILDEFRLMDTSGSWTGSEFVRKDGTYIETQWAGNQEIVDVDYEIEKARSEILTEDQFYAKFKADLLMSGDLLKNKRLRAYKGQVYPIHDSSKKGLNSYALDIAKRYRMLVFDLSGETQEELIATREEISHLESRKRKPAQTVRLLELIKQEKYLSKLAENNEFNLSKYIFKLMLEAHQHALPSKGFDNTSYLKEFWGIDAKSYSASEISIDQLRTNFRFALFEIVFDGADATIKAKLQSVFSADLQEAGIDGSELETVVDSLGSETISAKPLRRIEISDDRQFLILTQDGISKGRVRIPISILARKLGLELASTSPILNEILNANSTHYSDKSVIFDAVGNLADIGQSLTRFKIQAKRPELLGVVDNPDQVQPIFEFANEVISRLIDATKTSKNLNLKSRVQDAIRRVEEVQNDFESGKITPIVAITKLLSPVPGSSQDTSLIDNLMGYAIDFDIVELNSEDNYVLIQKEQPSRFKFRQVEVEPEIFEISRFEKALAGLEVDPKSLLAEECVRFAYEAGIISNDQASIVNAASGRQGTQLTSKFVSQAIAKFHDVAVKVAYAEIIRRRIVDADSAVKSRQAIEKTLDSSDIEVEINGKLTNIAKLNPQMRGMLSGYLENNLADLSKGLVSIYDGRISNTEKIEETVAQFRREITGLSSKDMSVPSSLKLNWQPAEKKNEPKQEQPRMPEFITNRVWRDKAPSPQEVLLFVINQDQIKDNSIVEKVISQLAKTNAISPEYAAELLKI